MTTAVQIRWLIRRDMPGVLDIERASFEYPWTEQEFEAWLRQRNCIGMVAEVGTDIVGYIVYTLNKASLTILNLAVHPDYRRQGVGRQLIQRHVDNLTLQCRRAINLDVSENNLPAQLFFSACGFRATSILADHYENTGAAAYRMRYRLEGWE